VSADHQQVTFSLSKALHNEMKVRAAGEDLFIAEAYASAARNWLDSMNGRGPHYKPTNLPLHNRLENLLNRRDVELTAALAALMGVLEKNGT
jgi:hypothetical protein